MTDEIYENWNPVPDTPPRVNLARLSDTDAGIMIDLQVEVGHGPILTLLFESAVAYRNINESYRIRTWNRIDTKRGTTLQRVQNSKWLAWLREEAAGVLDEVPLLHYAIFTDEDCVEIATEFPPEVSWSGV